MRSNHKKTSRILLVEDHPSLREALALVLDQEPDFSVVGKVGSLVEAREMLAGVDVAIIDPGLPDGSGVDLIEDLRRANPHCEGSPGCIVLVLTASLEPVELVRAVEAGAAGVLHKSASIDEIVDAVRRLCAGETLHSTDEIIRSMSLLTRRQKQDVAERSLIRRLTPREREVLQALADGLDNRGIARRLEITIKTEHGHMTSIFKKLEVHSRLQALVFAIRHDLVELRSAHTISARQTKRRG